MGHCLLETGDVVLFGVLGLMIDEHACGAAGVALRRRVSLVSCWVQYLGDVLDVLQCMLLVMKPSWGDQVHSPVQAEPAMLFRSVTLEGHNVALHSFAVFL